MAHPQLCSLTPQLYCLQLAIWFELQGSGAAQQPSTCWHTQALGSSLSTRKNKEHKLLKFGLTVM